MNPSRLFIQRPIATTLLMAAILLVGFVGFRQLPVSALPEVQYPTIQVLTFYPGASPDVMASAVTAPLERQFGQVPGLSQMTSTSAPGASLIVLQFLLTLNIDVAEQEVQEAINAAQTYLPADLPTPPIYSKINPADAPILTLALTSDELPLSKVNDLADTRLAQRISQVPGVGLVSLSGSQKPAVRVQANPTALSSYGINLEDLRSALQQTSVNLAKGSLDGPRQNYQIDSNDQLHTGEDYAQVVVAYRNGNPVRLSDVANVIDDVEDRRLAAWMNRTPAIILNVQRQPGANIIEVVDRIKALLPQYAADLPASLHIAVLADRTVTTRASVTDIEYELTLTIFLVVLVIYLFLRDARATVIPSVAVPLSLIGALGVIDVCGYSLNNLTLMALTIATGFVVDDAIVMIENITRFLEAGDPPLQAALKGAGQIGFTIVSLTISLIAVLIPLLMMTDIVGRLFREFAVTLAVTILFSAVVSLTLTPMMCSRLLRKEDPARRSRFYAWTERGWEAILRFYSRTLRTVLAHQRLTLLVAVATLVLTVVLYIIVPKGFFPVQDTGFIQGISEAPQSISFTAMRERQQALVDELLQDPAVDSVSSFIGIDGINMALNSGRLQINLKSLSERNASATDIIRRLQQRVAKVSGIQLFLQPVQDLTVETRAARTQYQYTLSDPNAVELTRWSQRVVERLKQLPEITDVATDALGGGLAERLLIDRATAGRMGISASLIDQTLYDAFGQRQILTLYTQVNQYHLVLEALPELQRGPESLHHIFLRSGLAGGAASSSPVARATPPAPPTSTALSPTAPATLTSYGGAVSAPSTSVTSPTPVSTVSSPVASTTTGSMTGSTTGSTTGTTIGGSATTGPITVAAQPTTGASNTRAFGGSSPVTSSGIVTSTGVQQSGSANGASVPLSALGHFESTTAPIQINRQGQFPMVTVSFNLEPKASLGAALSAIDEVQQSLHLPLSLRTNFQGAAASFRASLKSEPILILAALIAVYIVLGVLYESYIHPITILSTLPSAGVGACLALLITGTDLDVISIIGIILLIGIVKKNGIMMVDFALEAERKEGKSPEEAIFQASQLRLRPILMTTMAALLAGLPLAFGSGIGAELRRPLGITMVGGLLFSQVLTLYTTPVIYLAFDRLSVRMRSRRAASEAEPAPGSGPSR